MTRLLLIALLCLCACAPKVHVRDPQTATSIWDALHPAVKNDSISASFSLHVQTPRRTGRLLGQLWGYPDRAIRLDLTSGAGTSVAMIRETPDLWTAYLPSENEAYRHRDARKGLELFQIPVPFATTQISSLVAGDLSPILGQRFHEVRESESGILRYAFNRGDVLSVDIMPDMDVMVLHGRKGWTLTCEKPYTLPACPSRRLFAKFTFSSPTDGSAVLRIKSLDTEGAWQEGDLALNLPADVRWMRITTSHN